MKIANRQHFEQQYDITTSPQQLHTPTIIGDSNHNHYHFTTNNGEYECNCDNFTKVFPDMKERCSAKAVFINYPETPHKADDPTKVDPMEEINQECYIKFYTKKIEK